MIFNRKSNQMTITDYIVSHIIQYAQLYQSNWMVHFTEKIKTNANNKTEYYV